ncbi:hypothetical protein [Azorhizophilus paspali]|uniref:Uncharacterized protein n=1 Tax=Azorhizophilus paspali TaxID=69963 RepID=A0ABV6SLK8_AZOPA
MTVDELTDLDVAGGSVVWTLAFRRSSDKFDEVKRNLKLDRDRIVVFLHEKGFRPYEIEVYPLQAPLPQGHEAALRKTGIRFDGQGRVLVKTKRVDALARVASQVDPLIGAGIQFEAEPGHAAAVLTR